MAQRFVLGQELVPGRVDKVLRGLMNDVSRAALKAELGARRLERVYRALTLGAPQPATFSTLHGRDPRSRLRFSTRVIRGRRAVTHLAVLEKLAGGRAAWVECRLETGRTHQ